MAGKELTTDDKFEMLLDLLTLQAKSEKAITPETLKEIIEKTSISSAETMQKAMRPENVVDWGKSVFSYPEGDRLHPRPQLPFEFFYNGYPCHMFPETQHWRELELMAQVKPGEYTVLRKDATKMSVSVKAERDADLKITKLMVEFPVTRGEKAQTPAMQVLLYQLVYPDNPRLRFMEATIEHMQMTMGPEPVSA